MNGFGNSANNVLIGNTQGNILEGFAGNDTLAGWRGNDELRGGAGDDTYAFSRGDGVDAVIDSEGSGRLHFSGDISISDLTFSSAGDDLVIDVLDAGMPHGDRVILKNWMISPERVDRLSFCGNMSLPLDESVLNHAPEALADRDEVAEDIAVVASGNVLGNDSDPDQGQTLTVKNPGTLAGLYGSLTLAEDGSYQYVLDNARADIQALGAGQTREESFSYTVRDDGFGSMEAESTVSFTLRGTNDGPVVLADVAQVQEDITPEVTGNALTNDSDVDAGDHLAVADPGSRAGQYGQLTLAANGDYVYTLNNADVKVQSLAAGQTVTESFSYTAQDDSVEPGSASSEIIVTLTGANDAPVLDALLADRVVATGQAIAFALPAATFSDIDQGDVLTFTAQAVDAQGNVQALPSWLSFDAVTKTFSGTPAAVANLDIRVTATDRAGVVAFDDFNLAVTLSDEGGKGNEGLGNGQDAPPPGHNHNWNDGPGTSPGHPGRRGGGKKTSASTGADASVSLNDQVVGGYELEWNTVITTVNYVLPEHMHALVLDGSGAINGTGNALDNWLLGNSASNVLNGGPNDGMDIVQGGDGNDQLTDVAGNNLLDGGVGIDVLTDGEGASWMFGGKGNDIINLGQGGDLLGFNRGDGADVVNSGQEALANDVVSLGKGIRYADLRLAKKGNDLVLDVGAGDSITFSKWYVGSVNKGVGKLQVVTTEGDYDASSADKTRNQQVEVFDFAKLAQKFDAARTANAANANGWAMMNSLLDAHLQGSNTAALGGDLSYQYASTGSLAGIGLAAAQSSLAAGTDWQNLKSRSQLEQGSVRLMG